MALCAPPLQEPAIPTRHKKAAHPAPKAAHPAAEKPDLICHTSVTHQAALEVKAGLLSVTYTEESETNQPAQETITVTLDINHDKNSDYSLSITPQNATYSQTGAHAPEALTPAYADEITKTVRHLFKNRSDIAAYNGLASALADPTHRTPLPSIKPARGK